MSSANNHNNNNGSEKRILCVGMCVLDIIHVCENYPIEDTDKRCLDGYWQRGGNASNNCTVLRQLGADCEFLGMLSNAQAFEFLTEDCRKRGINIDNCPWVKQNPPFSSVILVQATDSRTIVHCNSNFPILTYEHFGCIDLSAYHWIHFEARNHEETLKMLQDILAHNKQHDEKIIISIDMEKLKTEHLVLAALADYIFLGKDMAQHLGWQNAHEAVHGLREMLLKWSSSDAATNTRQSIICPWGSQGSSCLDANDKYAHLTAVPPSKIVDALGAGDTFCAATIYALSLLQLSLEQAVDFGNRCAGYKLGHRGYDAVAEFQ